MVLGQYMKKNERESGISQSRGSLGLCRGRQIKSGTEYWATSAQLQFFG